MKAPNLEDLIAESESAHALTHNKGVWNKLLSWLLVLRGTAVSAGALRQACVACCPPSDNPVLGDSLMGSLVGLYIERFGETEIYHADAIRTNYGETPADTYFDLPKMLELVTDLRGDA